MGGFSYTVWLVLGLALIILEPLVPGLVVIFLGFGALLTAAVVYFDLIPGMAGQIFFWLITSGVMIGLLREQVRKIFPSLEKSEGSDETEYLDREVEVINLVDGKSDRGRVGSNCHPRQGNIGQTVRGTRPGTRKNYFCRG